ncbi:hypothetical protein HD554DRAFT_2023359, partial [Boletus coccyginus]
QAHQQAYAIGILHRDLSVRNIIIIDWTRLSNRLGLCKVYVGRMAASTNTYCMCTYFHHSLPNEHP